MQNLGEVFKELRKSRNVSLQEATGGEFTYSMLSKFERGEADLSSMKLITAVDNIHSDLNEFMYLVRGFSQKKVLAFQENLWDLYDREGIDSLQSLYEETIFLLLISGEIMNWNYFQRFLLCSLCLSILNILGRCYKRQIY